jgi:hypothetical protein
MVLVLERDKTEEFGSAGPFDGKLLLAAADEVRSVHMPKDSEPRVDHAILALEEEQVSY